MYIYIYIYIHIYIYILYIYILYIYIYNLRHENDLTPSQRTTQFYFSITLYIFLSFMPLVKSTNISLLFRSFVDTLTI